MDLPPKPGVVAACEDDGTGTKRCSIQDRENPGPTGMAGPCKSDADCAGLALHPELRRRGYTRHVCRESGIAGNPCFPTQK